MGTTKPRTSKSGTSKKRGHKETDTNEVKAQNTGDDRFAAARWDPTFSRVPKKAKRAVEDERFTTKLKSNPGFRKSETPVDRFGRPRKAGLEKSLQDAVNDDESELSEEEDEIQPVADLAQFDDGLDDSDSMDSDLEEFMEMEEEQEVIPRGESTNRLAVVGLDWSSVRAVDIYASLNSFCPPGKQVEYVEVHPSKFGLERLTVEAKLGPQVISKTDLEVAAKAKLQKSEKDEIMQSDSEDESVDADQDNDSDDEDAETKKLRQQAALRKYEEERLKYYYGVVKFEDIKSADVVYEQCDGVEYGQSGLMFDLRFIPDDMVIETTPRDRADKLPENYLPPNVNPSTLNNSKVKLSWDADDPDRVVLKKRTVGKKAIDEDNLKAYLASSSDEDEDAKPSAEEIDKKRSLLLGPNPEEEEEQPKNDDTGIEITFEPGMLEKGEEIVKRKQEREERKDETPWEARMRRQQERKAEKKKDFKLNLQKVKEGQEETEEPNLGFSDPFFTTDGESKKKSKKSKKKSQQNESNNTSDPTDETATDDVSKEKANLELLMMTDKIKESGSNQSAREVLAKAESDDEDERALRRKQKKTRGRRRGQVKDKEIEQEKPSVMDTNDSRFNGLFNSHLFAIDPTHPKYKENETTEKILKEKTRRAKNDPNGTVKSSAFINKPVSTDKNTNSSTTKESQKKTSEVHQLAAQVKARAKTSKKGKQKSS